MQSGYNYPRPETNTTGPGSHFSASSSVYSPVESEFPHKQQQGQTRESRLSSISSYNSRTTSIPDRSSPSMNKDESVQTFQSFVTAENGSNYSFDSINDSILKDKGRSFSDGSELVSGRQYNSDTTVNNKNTADVDPEATFDEDATPVLPYSNRNIDPIDDKTPLIGYEETIFPLNTGTSRDNLTVPGQEESTTGLGLGGGTRKSLLPQQELSNKFKRLSMTLQSSNQFTSGESVQFIHSFQQNVEKVNNDPSRDKKNRTSYYYKKINEKATYDDDDDDDSVHFEKVATIRDRDQQSLTSTASNTSSVLSRNYSREHGSDNHTTPSNTITKVTPNNQPQQPHLQPYANLEESSDGKSSSSNSFNFNSGETYSNGSSQIQSETSSYVDLRGLRISPKKAQHGASGPLANVTTPSPPKQDHNNDNDKLPIRKDLVKKFEKISPSNGYSDQEKNDYLIKVANQNGGKSMTEKYPMGLNISYTDSVLDPKNNKSFEAVEESVSDENGEEYEEEEQDTQIEETHNSIQNAYDNRNSTISSATNFEDDGDEDLSTLFVRALHTFDSSTLQSESDVSICLSFEKEDLAFVHTIDESGWGEVTLINSLKRGWIPMNYFAIAVGDDADGDTSHDSKDDEDEEDEEKSGKLPNSVYLKPLFHACGKFLMNPLSHRNRRDRYTFSIRVINSIRDGVRILLQETDCLSRSNEIVTKRPVVRKSRKSLLADWYNLMLKANQFKGTSNFAKIEVLTLMVYQVSRKAVDFLEIWSTESRQIIKRENEKKLQNDMNNYPLLSTPPQAKQRITELNGLLYSYLGMIIGRLDLIEHNPVGCEILESITHQIILLLRELLFISKTGSDFSSEKPSDLDGSLDTLLNLVSDLVSGVKCLVVKTLNETEEEMKYNGEEKSKQIDYYYTQEGGELIQIASKMIKSISTTILSIRELLEVTGDFKLNSERAYPDYSKMKIDPDDLIKKCSLGIAKAQDVKNRDLKVLRKQIHEQHTSTLGVPGNDSKNGKNKVSRYSMMRSGKTGELSFTENGANILHNILVTDFDGSSPFSISNAEFEPFSNEDPTAPTSERHNIKDELLVDGQGNLLGASFKGLVYTLTNESSPPEYFFVSTFFICFRSFANGIDLIEELITRFDTSQNQAITGESETSNISSEVKLKNRRRLIAKMFQLWMESYWNHESDYSLLTILINFFNESLSLYLPLDAMKLIEVAAKLSSKPLVENQKPNKKAKAGKQLFSRSITITRLQRKNSISAVLVDNSARYSMVDGYELSKINTNSSTQQSLASSMALPMPLGIGNQTSSSHTLLSKSQLVTIEKVNLTYRAILGGSWCNPKFIDTKMFVPLELRGILPNWYNICDQSWVLSNYRPNLLDFNGLEIAKQLTLIESHIFCSIKPDELLNENFTAKRAHLKLAPNIRQSLLFTNCLSGYVLESTLQPKINLKMRVNVVKTWLKIAISCLYLRNFNSLAAIITSLQSHLVTRLSKVWVELSVKYKDLYDYLSGIVHPDKNYTIYRSKLRNFLVANDYNVPIVPYFSLFLQDITFVTDGNPNYRKANSFLNQKLINIDKYLKLTRIIADIESLQIPYTESQARATSNSLASNANKRNTIFSISKPTPDKFEDYHIIPVPSLQELVLLELWKVCQLNRKEEDRAWKLSCLIHPREAT
ncbi:hypothetical protein CLIB1423_16S00540 [[Candida] railenensis]|uniref:Bud site selection protein 5 n=1 Tax=[Candida] railenensis TaxID=45579 RepID=A0A9P0W081_9ASCO|nr:hypothetical protein CLIB1423_16S00540 [[Candida] railenensis]